MMTEHQKDQMLLSFFIAFVLALILTVFTAYVVHAHEWYSQVCCGESHCHPVKCDEIRTQGEWLMWNGSRIEKFKAQGSPDGQCHVCVMENKVMLCIFLGGGV